MTTPEDNQNEVLQPCKRKPSTKIVEGGGVQKKKRCDPNNIGENYNYLSINIL